MEKFEIAAAALSQVRFYDVLARSNELVTHPDRSLVVEVWEADEGTFEHHLPGEEVLFCLEGEERVEDLVTGQVEYVRAGDVLYYPEGSHVRVTYTEPFRALIIQIAAAGVETLEPA